MSKLIGGDALPVLPPLKALTARRRLCSRFPVVRTGAACAAAASALRFRELAVAVDLVTPLGCPVGFEARAVAARLVS